MQLGLGQFTDWWLQSLVGLVAGGLVFAVIYVVVARRLRVHEIDDLVKPVMERVRRALPKR